MPDASTTDAGLEAWSLEVHIIGDGDGRVFSTPAGIDCPGRCRSEFPPGAQVVLEAEPMRPHRFEAWSGDCEGTTARCPVAGTTSVTATASFQPPQGLWRFSSIEDLGAFDPSRSRWAQDVNDRGDVVGSMDVETGSARPFRRIRTATSPVQLQGLGGTTGVAWSINATGWTVGESRGPDESYRAIMWEPAPSTRGTELGTFGGPLSYAYGINSANVVVGRAQTPQSVFRAFRWTSGGPLEDLGTLGGADSEAYDVNDAGEIVGTAATSAGRSRAVRRAATGGWVDLGTLAGPNSYGRRINGQGAVVGSSETPTGTHAFYVDPPPATAMVDIGTLGGPNSFGKGINDDGLVVGNSETASTLVRAFIWSSAERETVDLNALLPRSAPAWELRYATMINNEGTVVGTGVLDGQLRAFRMER